MAPDTGPDEINIETSVHPNLPEQLWDEAYDGLKTEEPKLMQLYETILSNKLHTYNFDPAQEPNENNIAPTGDKRREQLLGLIEAGRGLIERERNVKDGIEQAMGVVVSMKEIISSTVQTLPQAALPWSLVCLGIEIIQSPLKQQKTNDEGIRYVTKRMHWYWGLANDVLKEPESTNGDEMPGTQPILRSRLVELYKELLLFQIKSVCSYYRNRGLVFLRDVVKLDDWAGSVDNIRKLEADFRQDHGDHINRQKTDMSQQMIGLLEKLVSFQLTRMEEKDTQCLRDLRITDPRKDKNRIEEAKGGLLQDSYNWIIHTEEYKEWLSNEEIRLLWIKGDPGKGKTMLLCGIINELEKSVPFPNILAYSFCQGTDQKLNNAIAILRGIIYMLVCQQPSLISHLEKEYKNVGSRSLFEDANAWFTLCGIFTDMLQDPAVENSCLIIDALDECETDRKKLLDFIVKSMSDSPHVKWIVSSRNWIDIENKLRPSSNIVSLHLEQGSHALTVSTSVGLYIRNRISRLNVIEGDQSLQDRICDQMLQKSNGTFLWVALVFKELTDSEDSSYDTDTELLESFLNEMPTGLPSLYSRMMSQIDGLAKNDPPRCRTVLSVMALAYQPIRLSELPTLANFTGKLSKTEELEKLVQKCGSFLTIRGDTIYFIHQSAKEFLIIQKPQLLFHNGFGIIHRDIFHRSMEAMSTGGKLRHNMYSLPYPGVEMDEVSTPNPDPLAEVRYSCIYWLRHFCDGFSDDVQALQRSDSNDIEKIYDFFSQHFLQWLEALSLLRNMQTGIVSFQSVLALLNEKLHGYRHLDFFQDAMRFIFHNRYIVEIAPLQVYISALIFSPSKSIVRLHFNEELSWIDTLPEVDEHWSACLYTLLDNKHTEAIEFSGDSRLLASLSSYDGIKIWDTATGELLHTLTCHPDIEPPEDMDDMYNMKGVAFVGNSKLLVSDLSHGAIETRDAESGDILSRMEIDMGWCNKPPSNDPKPPLVKFGSLVLKDVATGEEVRKVICSILCFNNSISDVDHWALILDAHAEDIEVIREAGRVLLHKIEHRDENIVTIAFSPDFTLMASSYTDKVVRVWDIALRNESKIIRTETLITYLAFSRDSAVLAGVSEDGTIQLWNMKEEKGVLQPHHLRGHTGNIKCVTSSRDSNLWASASYDGTVKIWSTAYSGTSTRRNRTVDCRHTFVFSEDARSMAGLTFGVVKTQDTETGRVVRELKNREFSLAHDIALSNDAKLLAAASKVWRNGRYRLGVEVWSLDTEERLHIFPCGSYARKIRLAFSKDSKILALAHSSYDDLDESVISHVRLWNTDTGKRIQGFTIQSYIRRIIFNDFLYIVTEDIGCYRLVRLGAGEKYSDPESQYLFPADQVDTGFWLHSELSWITWNEKKMIWLPNDFRRHGVASSQSRVELWGVSGVQ
ncbi:Vegetative incompatibility protein HET-E-1 [Cladobotryum mycophilum]|uniref:Vegetative incompatibility protein HET-E-1 n=1 Tax=Cladobotryum mycophilum TaxID=491253 RepID=A0ABR0SYH3_9HYPO